MFHLIRLKIGGSGLILFTFKIESNEPECENFLKIRKGDNEYYTIDKFISKYKFDSDKLLSDCIIWYRGEEKNFNQMNDDEHNFSSTLKFYNFDEPFFVIDKPIQAAIYFAKKGSDCLQTARFFTMKSALILDSDCNLRWDQGYAPQYLFRCIYFGTASTWYSNSFDHILQIAYWGLHLYTAAKDRGNNAYNASWEVKTIMKFCTYEFIVGELKNRGLLEIRKCLTECSGKIEEVRSWANYIKHKGGIDYKYLEAENPFKIYITPIETGTAGAIDGKRELPEERFVISDFKSPVEVDIDEKLSKLKDTHIAIHQCLGDIVKAIDFDKYSVIPKSIL